MTPLATLDGVFLTAVEPLVDFAPLVVGKAPGGFFSPTLLFKAGAVGFLGTKDALLFLSSGGVVFFATPLVCGLDTPFERRLWEVFGLDPAVVLVWLRGLVFTAVLLVVLALESPEILVLVLAGVFSLAFSGFESPCPLSPAHCTGASSTTGLAAWLGSCPVEGAASLSGLDSSASIGSSAVVITPSGFISPGVVVVVVVVYRLSGVDEVWSAETVMDRRTLINGQVQVNIQVQSETLMGVASLPCIDYWLLVICVRSTFVMSPGLHTHSPRDCWWTDKRCCTTSVPQQTTRTFNDRNFRT